MITATVVKIHASALTGGNKTMVPDGYVIADGQQTKFRTWKHGPWWTDDVDEALWFARRSDAEKFCEDDDDAWYIVRASAIKAALTK